MFIADRIRDYGLDALSSEAEEVHICSAEPTTYTEAKTTFTLGNKTSPVLSSPADGSGGGRSSTLSAITDGDVTGTGNATHFAIIDVSNTRLLAVGALASSVAVSSGNTFTLTACEINFPDTA